MSENNKDINNKGQGGLKYNPSQKIRELAELFEKGIKFNPGNKSSEKTALKKLSECSEEISAIEENKEYLDKKNGNEFAKIKEKFVEQTKDVLEDMAKNRIERKKGFFGFFVRSNLLNALVVNDICNKETGDVSIDNLAGCSEVPKLSNSVMTPEFWNNIAYGCLLAEEISEGFAKNEEISNFVKNLESVNYEEKWKSTNELIKAIVPELNLDSLCQTLGYYNKAIFTNSSADLDDWGNVETQKEAESGDSYLCDIKKNLEYHEKKYSVIKGEIESCCSNLNCSLSELINCYFRLMVLNQVCQMVQYFNITGKLGNNYTEFFSQNENINKEKYNEYMKKKYPRLYGLSKNIYAWMHKRVKKLMYEMQYATCIAAFNKIGVKMSYEGLPPEIKSKLYEKYKGGMGISEGSRPLGFDDLKGDVEQQTAEAVETLLDYAKEHNPKKK